MNPTQQAAQRSFAVRIPADVDREDRVLANLTARQLAILAVTALVLYAGYAATRALVPVIVFLVAAVPVAAGVAVLVLSARDGMSLDRLLLAAIRQRLSPRIRVAAVEGVLPPPQWLTARASTPGHRRDVSPVAPASLRLPAEGVGQTGVVDLGADGMAVVCACSTVNFALRTPTEQEALVAAFGRYLHCLTAPVQVLVRAQRLDLCDQIVDLRARAAGLAHPALEAAALEHADYLAQLASGTDLLRRQVLLILREPLHLTGARRDRLPAGLRAGVRGRRAARPDEAARSAAEVRLARRVAETVQLLTPAGIVVTALDAGQATAVLASACDPDTLISPSAELAAAGEVITLTPAEHENGPHVGELVPRQWQPDSPETATAAVTDGGSNDGDSGDGDSGDGDCGDGDEDEEWWAR